MERLSDTIRVEASRFGASAELAQIVERWVPAVGEAIARNAWPSRIARDGTLHVNTADSVWAFELGHRSGEIAARIGIESIRFAPGPLAGGEPTPARERPAEPSAEETAEAARVAAGIADKKLRETIEKALGLSLARSRSHRPL